MAVELGTAYVAIQPSMQGLESLLTKQLGGDADKAGAAAGASAGKSFAGSFSGLVKGIGAGLAVGIGAGVGLEKLGAQFDDAFDTIRVGTGKTGDALAGLEGSFKNVVKSVPTDFESASTAISSLSQRLGVTGAPLEGLSKQFLELSRITGTDLASSLDLGTRLFGDWNIELGKQPAALDKVFRASQSSGIGIDQLMQSVVQFGAPLRNLGFGFEQSVALLGQFSKAGVNTETVFAGLKAGVGKLAKAGEPIPETFRRVVSEIQKMGPGTEATGKAIELFGQRAGPDLADAIAGGKFNIDEMLGAITGGKDTILGAAKDTADWAEQWTLIKNKVFVALEPLATRVFGAIGDGVSKAAPFVEKLTTGLVNMAGGAGKLLGPFVDKVVELAGSFRDALPSMAGVGDVVKNVLNVALDKAGTIIGFLADHMKGITQIAVPLLAGLVAFKVVSGIISAVSAAMGVLNAVMALNPITLVVAAIAALAAGLVVAYQKVGWFRDAVDATGRFLRDKVWPILQTIGRFLGEVFGYYIEYIGFLWRNVWGPVLSWLVDVFTTKVLPVLQAVGSFLRDVLAGAISFIADHWRQVWEPIVSFVTGVFDRIRGVVDGAMQAVKGIIDVFLGLITGNWGRAWQGLKDAFGGIWDAIRNYAMIGIEVVLDLFRNLPGKLLGLAGALLDGAKALGAAIWHGIIDGITGAVGFLGDIASKIWNGIAGFINTKFIDPISNFKVSIPIVGDIRPFSLIGKLRIPTFHEGGIVPGRPGDEVLIKALAGERVLSVADTRNAELAAPAGAAQVIEHMTVVSPEPPRRWLEAGVEVRGPSPDVMEDC